MPSKKHTSIFQNIKNTALEIRKIRKKDLILNVKIRSFNDVRDTFEYQGKFDPTRLFCYIVDQNRVLVKPQIFWENGEAVVYTTEKTHGQINIEKLKEITEKTAALAELKLYKDDNLSKTRLTCLTPAHTGIDWTIYDNELSPNFSIDSDLVVKSNIMRSIMETPNIKMLFAILLSLFVGLFIGFSGSTVINLIYRFIQ